MNKKQLSAFVIFLAYALSAYAQKLDLDKKKFTVEYLTLPTNTTLPYFDKYSADFLVDPLVVKQLQLKPETINSFFKLDGYLYSRENADFNYSIQIEQSKVLEENIITKKETYKNSDGSTKTVIKYIATCVVVVPTTLSFKLVPYGTIIYTSKFADYNDPIVYQSSPQLTYQNGKMLLDTKIGGIPSDAKAEYIQLLTNKVKQLKRDCCFSINSSSAFLLTMNEKDTIRYGTFNKSVLKAVSILSDLKYNKPLDEARKQMAEILKYWSECNRNVSSTEKHFQKYKYAFLWNLAICQFYLEYLDECKITCIQLKATEHNEEGVEDLRKNVVFVQQEFFVSGLKSRHINRIGFNAQEYYEYIPTEVPVDKKDSGKK